ncbi:enoyl-CoA hydratase/isomerase family protein [Natrarchaeobius oligotrophus]|uniref:Enoyl-CoA hydratase n=1 Tax=Natrarchaeobius chitinivorans TaxID=1679083 RepID=A0A3N6MF70_NATCH|nr:enoyl-CoA hydratase [Natrarchaeobius chitinivorans]RQH02589.1 enoyl-CoA hydratase [Natrarchaeobius chitinivorans]
MSDDCVSFETDDGVTTITFDDPDRRNPLSHDVKTELLSVLPTLPDDEDVRCVVFQGAGSAFSSGGDIDAMKERRRLQDEGGFEEVLREELRLANRMVRTVHTLPIPTIAKLDGPAVGSGAALALACDVRLASESGRIGFGFRHVGLSVDSGVSYLLPRLVGLSKAKDLALTGEIVDAETARELGLVDRLYDDDEFETEASEYVETLATGPSVALEHIKLLMNGSFDTDLQSALEREKAAQEVVAHTDDHVEGVDAFLEKRSPEFTGQ